MTRNNWIDKNRKKKEKTTCAPLKSLRKADFWEMG